MDFVKFDSLDNTGLAVDPPVPSYTASVFDPARDTIVLDTSGPVGPPGPGNMKIQADDPGLTTPGLWIQTFPNGDMTFWVEDGQL